MEETTERRRVEEALRESEKRYKLLLGSVTDYIYTVQVQDGRSVATVHGPGCAAVTGYAPEDYAADPDLWYRMVYEPDRQAVMQQAVAIVAGEASSPTRASNPSSRRFRALGAEHLRAALRPPRPLGSL